MLVKGISVRAFFHVWLPISLMLRATVVKSSAFFMTMKLAGTVQEACCILDRSPRLISNRIDLSAINHSITSNGKFKISL